LRNFTLNFGKSNRLDEKRVGITAVWGVGRKKVMRGEGWGRTG